MRLGRRQLAGRSLGLLLETVKRDLPGLARAARLWAVLTRTGARQERQHKRKDGQLHAAAAHGVFSVVFVPC